MNIVNDVLFAYNDFGQLTTDYQSHEDAVNPATTPRVQYSYADGSNNTIRPTALVYPNGRELHYNYGSTGEMNDAASRVASLVDDDGTTHLVDYSYLGRGGSAQYVNAPRQIHHGHWTSGNRRSQTLGQIRRAGELAQILRVERGHAGLGIAGLRLVHNFVHWRNNSSEPMRKSLVFSSGR